MRDKTTGKEFKIVPFQSIRIVLHQLHSYVTTRQQACSVSCFRKGRPLEFRVLFWFDFKRSTHFYRESVSKYSFV